jgi:hypothetical protein
VSFIGSFTILHNLSKLQDHTPQNVEDHHRPLICNHQLETFEPTCHLALTHHLTSARTSSSYRHLHVAVLVFKRVTILCESTNLLKYRPRRSNHIIERMYRAQSLCDSRWMTSSSNFEIRIGHTKTAHSRLAHESRLLYSRKADDLSLQATVYWVTSRLAIVFDYINSNK